jgi:hypothetical protein
MSGIQSRKRKLIVIMCSPEAQGFLFSKETETMDHFFSNVSSFVDTLPAWLTAVTGVIAAASAVAALTPTPRDDKILGKARKVVDLLALNVGYARRRAQKRK